MKKSSKISLTLALVMVIAAMVIPAWSYFTTYAQARGGVVINLGETSKIRESFDSWKKTLVVENEDENVTVFIRAKAFSGYATSGVGEGWTLNAEDGYYYYADPVAPGGETKPLVVTITPPDGKHEEGDTFNVVVIYESTPARYDEKGIATYDWSEVLNIVTEEGGN